VLVRALELLEGIKVMHERRGVSSERELTSGPGKLTRAMGITKKHHGLDLTNSKSELAIIEGRPEQFKIGSSHRIGVSADLKRKLRFFVWGNPFVSR